MKVVIVTGLSGAGKTQAMNCLEDLGYYCIDNMPPALIKNFLELTAKETNHIEQAAMVIDVRGGEFFSDAKRVISEMKGTEIDHTVIFLEASRDTLLRRFNETRRAHPLAEKGQAKEGIEKEIKLLAEIRKLADVVIDTSNMKAARLKEEIQSIVTSGKNADNFIINISSFGFKYGIPLDAELVFDVRFIPNPYYVASLKSLTGNNKKVQDFVLRQNETKEFVELLDKMIMNMIPNYIREGKYYVNIAFGCTGGQHRSVTLANTFVKMFNERGMRTTLNHRELD